MNAAKAVVISLAICLPCTFALSDDVEAKAQLGAAGWETAYAASLQQSVDYYDAGDFERSLRAAENALGLLNQQSAMAYNNICTAQMRLGAYERAAWACNKALQLVPGYERAQNNLTWIYVRVAEQAPTVAAYLNLSVGRYWQGDLDESILAAQLALELDPDNAIAHNNICAAFAKGGAWEPAVRECEIALELDPDYTLAKSNLEWARGGRTD